MQRKRMASCCYLYLELLAIFLVGLLSQSCAEDTSIWDLRSPLPVAELDLDSGMLSRTTDVTASKKNLSWSPAGSVRRKLSTFSLLLESSSPTTGCEDSTLSFIIAEKKRDCEWVARGNTKKKCRRGDKKSVSSFCPVTCGLCDKRACKNPSMEFQLRPDRETYKDCKWVEKDKQARCAIPGVASTCRKVCNPICKLPVVQNVKQCTGSEPCGKCKGICEVDDDCKGARRCMRRSGGENVPGCRWSGLGFERVFESDNNFCFQPEPESGVVSYVGECGEEGYTCRKCEGNCSKDDDCKGDKICLKRTSTESVPGCSGVGEETDVSGTNICIEAFPVTSLVQYDDDDPSNCRGASGDEKCDICTGDCDNDDDCKGDLRCAQRKAGYYLRETNFIPGCTLDTDWNGPEPDWYWYYHDDDYCFMPTLELPGIINYIGSCALEEYSCGECEGGCTNDYYSYGADANGCKKGLKCMERSGYEEVPGCSGQGGARDMFGQNICYKPTPIGYIDSLRVDDDGTRCSGSCFDNSDCEGDLKCFQRDASELVPGCVSGGPGDISGMNYCYVIPPQGDSTYIPGLLTAEDANGLSLSMGLSARIIAKTNETVTYVDGGISDVPFHTYPDGAGIIPVLEGANAGGWVYASNSEDYAGLNSGGVGAITFNSDGDIVNYQMVITGTNINCSGGKTYWGTWVSCEEYDDVGQCWEVDPIVGISTQQKTVIGGAGGSYEAFAYDNRDIENPTFYVTHDDWNGATVRFTPDSATVIAANESNDYSNMLTTTLGTLEWLILEPENGSYEDLAGFFSWSSNRTEADINAGHYYRNAEGIDIRGGNLYMTTKTSKSLFILDLDNFTYTRRSTVSGAFDGQPDQVASIIDYGNSNSNGPDRDLLYFAEEASYGDNGVHARDSNGFFYTIFNGPGLDSETTGLAFSPDNTRMYVAYQRDGIIFEITRDDGYPFGAHRLDIKYHA